MTKKVKIVRHRKKKLLNELILTRTPSCMRVIYLINEFTEIVTKFSFHTIELKTQIVKLNYPFCKRMCGSGFI